MTPVVLLVMPDPFFSKSLADRLRQLTTSVLTATDMLEALAACAGHPVDIVLLDVRAQEIRPLQILTGVKETYPDTEVILLSSHDNIATAMAGMRQGAADEILIPFDIGNLKQKLQEALLRKNSRTKGRKKRSFFNIFGDAMMAATFAQAGEFETAREIVNEGNKGEVHEES